MAHSYIEVANTSRSISVTTSGISQKVEIILCLDDALFDPPPEPEDEQTLLDHPDPDYDFLDASDDVVATEYAYTVFPSSRIFPNYVGDKKLLILNDLQLTQLTHRRWKVIGTYGYDLNRGTGGEGVEENEVSLPYVRINFSIGGGSRKIYKSLEVLDAIPSDDSPLPGAPANEAGAIGLSQDKIEGTEVSDSALRVQITAYYSPSFVDLEFILLLRDAKAGPNNYGTYNDAVFMGGQAGEVKLENVSGGGTVGDVIPITFDFIYAKNITAGTDEGFQALTMKGHDLLDYVFLPTWNDTAGISLLQPDIRYVHRIADPYDYSLLRLPNLVIS